MMSPQCQMVLQYMADYGSITSRDAAYDLGVYRLASRISDLKRKGYNISSKMESTENRYGKTVSYKRYWISEERDEPVA